MTTDDERREISKSLRNAEIDGFAMLYGAQLGSVTGTFAQIVSTHPDQLRRTLDNLADLIEPSVPGGPGEGEPTGKTANRDSLLALADELRRSLGWLVEDADGDVRVQKETLESVERRIREHAERTVDGDALLTLTDEMNDMFRIGAASGAGLDAKWCRELHDKFAHRIRETVEIKKE